jgi:Domain of unknown function (DUF4251)
MRYLLADLSLFFASTLATRAQSVKPLLDSQNYVFVANAAQPIGSSAHGLAEFRYTIKITKDTVVCGLPYWGRSTTAFDNGESPLVFTSKKFSYKITPGKNDGWKVLIRPKDSPESVDLQLNIGADGFTSVTASFNDRQPISFTGAISASDKP